MRFQRRRYNALFDRGVARISVGGGGHRSSADARNGMDDVGTGCHPSHWRCGHGESPENFFEFFYIKMVSCQHSAYYRLAACFTRIGSIRACGNEIHWRSFQHFENYNYSLRKSARKMTKMHQKIVEIARKQRCFVYIFRIYLLKIFEFGGLGGMPPVAPHDYAPCYTSTNYIERTSGSGTSRVTGLGLYTG